MLNRGGEGVQGNTLRILAKSQSRLDLALFIAYPVNVYPNTRQYFWNSKLLTEFSDRVLGVRDIKGLRYSDTLVSSGQILRCSTPNRL